MAKWIKRDGNKSDTVIWAAYKGLEVYTRGYIEATKESYVGTEREGKRNVTFEGKIQEVVAGLGISGEKQEQTTGQREQVEALRGVKEETEGKLRALGQRLQQRFSKFLFHSATNQAQCAGGLRRTIRG